MVLTTSRKISYVHYIFTQTVPGGKSKRRAVETAARVGGYDSGVGSVGVSGMERNWDCVWVDPSGSGPEEGAWDYPAATG